MTRIALSLFAILLCIDANGQSAHTAQELKQEIVILAKQTTNLAVKPVPVRAQLEKLALQLQQLSPKVDEQAWAMYAPGNWRQIWSDERDNSPPGSPPLDLANVYQVMKADGRAVNFGIRLFPDGTKSTFALEAAGTVQGDQQQTTILNGFFRNTGLKSGESLELLAEDILAGTPSIFSAVKLPNFPKGPIGATSPLKFLYMDQTIKIGTAPNAFTGDTELFIVERVSSVN